MSALQPLPGLERLMSVCQRLRLEVETAPPGHSPPRASTLVAGVPLDPLLAALYARLGFASFATDMEGIILSRCDDAARQLEEDNLWWSGSHRKHLALPTFIFAGEPGMAYHYATIPGLADDQGRQPVVWVDVYEEPFVVPVASTVDQFFDTYSRYLEALMALPNAREEKGALLSFPWEAPGIIGRDARLVELLRGGSFSPLMRSTGNTPAWVTQVLTAADKFAPPAGHL
jgi:hypothetical protein